MRLATNANPGHRSRHSIVLDQVLLQPIAMARHPLALLAEKDAFLMIATYLIITQEIVRILMPDRDAIAAIVFWRAWRGLKKGEQEYSNTDPTVDTLERQPKKNEKERRCG